MKFRAFIGKQPVSYVSKIQSIITPTLFFFFFFFFKKTIKHWGYYECLCPSVCPLHYLLLNHWTEFNQMVRM